MEISQLIALLLLLCALIAWIKKVFFSFLAFHLLTYAREQEMPITQLNPTELFHISGAHKTLDE